MVRFSIPYCPPQWRYLAATRAGIPIGGEDSDFERTQIYKRSSEGICLIRLLLVKIKMRSTEAADAMEFVARVK